MSRPARRRLQALAALLFATATAAAPALGQPMHTLASVPAQMRLNAEQLRLPEDEDMGLVGTSYLLELAPGVWAGPAAYGAISGRRGGLFTVGGELAWQQQLAGRLWLELGVYAGGGGGGAAPVGGGLMLRPHADLLWDWGGGKAGLSFSRVRFANGRIDSEQFGLVWSMDTRFRYVPAARLGRPVIAESRSGLGFDRFLAVAGVYRPSGDGGRVSGGDLPAAIGYAGARLERDIGKHLWWGLEAAGAATGGVSGYAEYLATLGAETAVGGRSLRAGVRGALGMGGGGDVDVGGGLLLKAGVYGLAALSDGLDLMLEAGLVRAPQGRFHGRYGTLALNWRLDSAAGGSRPVSATRMEWVGGIEHYSAARRDGSTRGLQAVSLRINRFLGPALYLSGQAHSAYAGGAGGYSVGLLGAGWQARLGERWHWGAEALIGAAGGGGVDTGGGALVQPMAYLGYALQPGVSLRLGAGRIRSLRGPLDGRVLELSMAFSFGVTDRGGR